jgi:hypothetical protein
MSCTVQGLERKGWMATGQADRLLYCFEQEGDTLSCWWMDFPALREWFWSVESSFAEFQMTKRNQTAGRVVPIQMVCKSGVLCKHFELPNRSQA